MQAVFGLVIGAGGGLGAWLAFREAEMGEYYYNLVGMGAVIVCIIGILLIFTRFKKWWMSE